MMNEYYEYINNIVKVSRYEYYNKKNITDDKNNIVCNNELIKYGFIHDKENYNSEFIDREEYNNNELINDGFIDSEDEKILIMIVL